MNQRQHIIAKSFARFAKVRRLPADDQVVEVAAIALDAAGMQALDPDERRYIDACVSCGWWTPYTPRGEPDRAATATGPPRGTEGIQGRATIWD